MAKQIKRQITQIRYNWRMAGEMSPDDGEEFEIYSLDKGGVIKITNCTPPGEPRYVGTAFYDVEFEDGRIETIYNPNLVVMEPVEHKEDPADMCDWQLKFDGHYTPGCINIHGNRANGFTKVETFKVCPYCAKPLRVCA